MSETPITDLIPAVTIEVIWFDDDMIELQLAACSTNFSAKTTFYDALDAPAKFAERIDGFPRNASDTREYELGQAKPSGSGGAAISLRCKDETGHLFAKVSVYGNTIYGQNIAESAVIYFELDPVSIDSFVEGLRNMRVRKGDRATLQGISSGC